MAYKTSAAGTQFIRYSNVGGEHNIMHLCMCRHCQKVFWHKMKRSVCDECKVKDNELFERIEQYLMEYPNSNAIQIADALKIQPFEVISFIDDGRLTMVQGKFEQLD